MFKDLPVDDLDLEGDLADDWGMEDEEDEEDMEKTMEKPMKTINMFSSEWLIVIMNENCGSS